MAARVLTVYNPDTNVIEPIDAADTLALTPAQIAALAADLGTSSELHITGVAFDAPSATLTLTRSDAATFDVVITDVDFAAAVAPATTDDPAIPTTFFGANTARLGAPTGWMSINGHKVPYFD